MLNGFVKIDKWISPSRYMDLSKLINGSCYMDLSTLLFGVVKVLNRFVKVFYVFLAICQTKTSLKFEQDFRT